MCRVFPFTVLPNTDVVLYISPEKKTFPLTKDNKDVTSDWKIYSQATLLKPIVFEIMQKIDTSDVDLLLATRSLHRLNA